MSHFSTLVCLPADTELSKLEDVIGSVMERWDENREVPEFRDYEEGSPDEHWWAKVLKRDGEKFGTATYESELTEARKRQRSYDRETPEERAQKELRDIEEARGWIEKFGAGPWTWAQVAEAYNARFHPGNEVATTDDDSDNERLRIDDEGRAYTFSTRNPEAKWDYWRIGGRWRNYFIARRAGAGLITSARSWDSPADGPVLDRLRVDGGPVGLLDFEAMREEWADKRVGGFDTWQAIVDKHGRPPAWRDLCGLVDLKELDIDEARRRYNTHPAIKAAREADIDSWGESLEETYGTTREEFIRLARLEAVPGYALVTLDGEWMAPGRMGWFGMSSDEAGEREAYRIEANRYLEALDPGVFVVALDLHI